ncbi:MAG: TCP-1/cpn60 chaperonin family protein [Rhodopila sp.]
MPKMMLHDEAARRALGRGVAQLARAVRGTLGPRGMNAIIDRPVGTPIISRDGVSIAAEVELEDPFENMGAQVLREVSMKTNEVVGDGTTTATVLADAMVQQGLAALDAGANPVELVRGLELAVQQVTAALLASAIPISGPDELRAVATIAANDPATGELVAEALERVGPNGIVTVEYGTTVQTLLEVVDGMAFDRGYLSHHMVTDVERMHVVLDDPYILMTDLKLLTQDEVKAIQAVTAETNRPLRTRLRDQPAQQPRKRWPARRRDSSPRLRPLAQGDAGGPRHRDRRPRHRPRPRRDHPRHPTPRPRHRPPGSDLFQPDRDQRRRR